MVLTEIFIPTETHDQSTIDVDSTPPQRARSLWQPHCQDSGPSIDRPRSFIMAEPSLRASLKELCAFLREETKDKVESGECASFEIALDVDTSIPLLRPQFGPYSDGERHDIPAVFKTNCAATCDDNDNVVLSSFQATVHDLVSVTDRQDRQIIQRAAARGIVSIMESVDGFKYSINNVWASKEDDGHRFSYICQDSMQNKDRHANGGKGSAIDQVIRKPTFNCKGTVAIKFSMLRSTVEVHYTHHLLHPPVAHNPSRGRSAKSAKQNLVFKPYRNSDPGEGGLAAALGNDAATGARSENSNIGKPLKRKQGWPEVCSGAQSAQRGMRKPMTLRDCLRVEAKKNSTKTSAPRQSKAMIPNRPPPMDFDLPSWAKPPTPPAALAAPFYPPSTAAHPSDPGPNGNKFTCPAPYQPSFGANNAEESSQNASRHPSQWTPATTSQTSFHPISSTSMHAPPPSYMTPTPALPASTPSISGSQQLHSSYAGDHHGQAVQYTVHPSLSAPTRQGSSSAKSQGSFYTLRPFRSLVLPPHELGPPADPSRGCTNCTAWKINVWPCSLTCFALNELTHGSAIAPSRSVPHAREPADLTVVTTIHTK